LVEAVEPASLLHKKDIIHR